MTTTSFPAADTIGAAELAQLIAAHPELRVLDVRTGAEFEAVHIPGSYNVPLDTLGEHLNDLADVDHPVVLVCQSGGRATNAHKSLLGAGKETLHILDGGMGAWQTMGGDVVRTSSERWALDRQVRLLAGGLIALAVAASVLATWTRWVALFVGGGLFVSAVTNSCVMAAVLGKLPYNRGKGCNIAEVLEGLNGGVAS